MHSNIKQTSELRLSLKPSAVGAIAVICCDLHLKSKTLTVHSKGFTDLENLEECYSKQTVSVGLRSVSN